jgi:hypothetical protein
VSDTEAEQPATDSRLKFELELLERVKTVASAAIAVLGVCAVLGTFALVVWGRAEARTTEQVDPIKTDVALLKAQVPFILSEQREQRREFRAYVDQGPAAMELRRPMAPLPLPVDGGL